MTSAETGVPTTEPARVAAAAGVTAADVTSTMLRPEGDREKKRERRDGCQATHMPLL